MGVHGCTVVATSKILRLHVKCVAITWHTTRYNHKLTAPYLVGLTKSEDLRVPHSCPNLHFRTGVALAYNRAGALKRSG